MKQTSIIARQKFEAEGKVIKHSEIILWTLDNFGPATAYGIAKNAYYQGKDNQGNLRTFKLGYVQIGKRMSELVRLGKVIEKGTQTDPDGALRTVYESIKSIRRDRG